MRVTIQCRWLFRKEIRPLSSPGSGFSAFPARASQAHFSVVETFNHGTMLQHSPNDSYCNPRPTLKNLPGNGQIADPHFGVGRFGVTHQGDEN
jgi:hypothetical protein